MKGMSGHNVSFHFPKTAIFLETEIGKRAIVNAGARRIAQSLINSI